MRKGPRLEPAAGAGPDRLWLHLGRRMRFRREQLEIPLARAAGHIQVARATYQSYESGERLVPADELAALAELLAVPVFYFFDDLRIGEGSARGGSEQADPAFAVATESDRIGALIEDFQALDFDGQQHLLALARALAGAARRTRTAV